MRVLRRWEAVFLLCWKKGTAVGYRKRFLVHDEGVNAYGFRVLTEGIRLDQYVMNPVGFYNHDRERGVICRWTDVRKDGQRLEGTAEFDEEDELGRKVAGKVERGFLRGASIGIRVLAVSEAPELMLPGQKLPTVTESELVEISVVDIPANRRALALYGEGGEPVSEGEVEQMFKTLMMNQKKQEPMKGEREPSAEALRALGLHEGAGVKELEAKALELLAERDRLSEALAAEQAKQKAAQEARVKALVDAAVQARKLTSAERGRYEALGLQDAELLEAVLRKLEAPMLPGGQVKPEGRNGAEAALRALVKGRKLRELEKEDAKLALRIRREAPELWEELWEEQYGKKD